MFDCCPKELSGFERSLWKERGTKVCLCYFHFKKAWTDICAVKMPGSSEACFNARDKIMQDLDNIVWAEVGVNCAAGAFCSRNTPLALVTSLAQSEELAVKRFRKWSQEWGADDERGRLAKPFVAYIHEHYGEDKLPHWAMAFRATVLGCA
jgi:hypothetical protein